MSARLERGFFVNRVKCREHDTIPTFGHGAFACAVITALGELEFQSPYRGKTH